MSVNHSQIISSTIPARAREWEKCPHQLWALGDTSLLDGMLVSIVGSRKVSCDGTRRTLKLSKQLVGFGVTVMSGMAEGVDTAAHEATLTAKGKTIAVMGTPITECFPAKNRYLKSQIAKSGLILSQFEPGSATYPSNFPRRNELMAALSHMTIVVEASSRSGTRHQVAMAIKMGRPVGFLSSLARANVTWIDEAMGSGFGFEVKSVQDVVERLNMVNPLPEDLNLFPINLASKVWKQSEFDLDT